MINLAATVQTIFPNFIQAKLSGLYDMLPQIREPCANEPTAAIEDVLPDDILVKILGLCDIHTQDEALRASKTFLKAVVEARCLNVRLAAKSPTRVTDELLPTRSELYLNFCSRPHFKNIIETLKPLGPPRKGPLHDHYKEQIEFNKAVDRGWLLGGIEAGRSIQHSSQDTLGYFGGWRNNQPEGFGKMLDICVNISSRFPGMDYRGLNYEGNYAKGKRHGYGFMVSRSNFYFEGFFIDDHAYGRGVLHKEGSGYDINKRIKDHTVWRTEGFFTKGVWEKRTNFYSGSTDIMKLDSLIVDQTEYKDVTLNRELGFMGTKIGSPGPNS